MPGMAGQARVGRLRGMAGQIPGQMPDQLGQSPGQTPYTPQMSPMYQLSQIKAQQQAFRGQVPGAPGQAGQQGQAPAPGRVPRPNTRLRKAPRYARSNARTDASTARPKSRTDAWPARSPAPTSTATERRRRHKLTD